MKPRLRFMAGKWVIHADLLASVRLIESAMLYCHKLNNRIELKKLIGEAETQKGSRHVDHVQPISRGGLHEVSNLCIACKKCNLSKGACEPDQFWARRTS
jgi:5-methylcytosine-specific restriction endonuclease McrA